MESKTIFVSRLYILYDYFIIVEYFNFMVFFFCFFLLNLIVYKFNIEKAWLFFMMLSEIKFGDA